MLIVRVRGEHVNFCQVNKLILCDKRINCGLCDEHINCMWWAH